MKKILLSVMLAATTMIAGAQETFDELRYSQSGSSFRLNAPSKAKSVKVHIYTQATGGERIQTVKMKRTGGCS